MEDELRRLRAEAEAALLALNRPEDLEPFRVNYLGRKSHFTTLMRRLGQASAEERPRLGKLANEIKAELESAFNAREQEIMAAAGPAAPAEDLTLPGRRFPFGRPHPVAQVMDEVCAVFIGMGFGVAQGPDVETDFYNFEALNIPAHHPARAMHDTFYVDEGKLLRTHTSPIQIRAMEKQRPPLRMIAPGKVYRCDSDITHTPMFHQVEGFMVDRRVSFADLKGVLSLFIARIFDRQTRIRFRPSFFPFTEPSVEVDIGCVICGGAGCRVCKQSGWQFSGFAFGLGIERIAMLRYGITDIRLFYENDLRFLAQF